MNILNILKGLENLAVELLLWIVYIPKTLYRIIKDPFWVRTYINEQLEKDSKFNEYMSPVLLYLGTSVILYFLNEALWSGKTTNWAEKASGIESLLFLSLPLFVALVIEWFRSKPLSRALILRGLFIQCYFFSPLMLAFFAFQLSDQLWITDGKPIFNFIDLSEVPVYLFILTLIWFIVIQVKFIANDLELNRFKAFGIMVFCIIILTAGFNAFLFLSSTERDSGGPGEMEYADFIIQQDGEYRIELWSPNSDNMTYEIGLFKTDSIRPLQTNLMAIGSDSIQIPDDDIFDAYYLRPIKIGEFIKDEAYISQDYFFKGKRNQRLTVEIRPSTNTDVAFDVINTEAKSILLPRTDWMRYARLGYILLFGYAVFLGYRAFFIYRRQRIQDRKNQEAIKKNAKES